MSNAPVRLLKRSYGFAYVLLLISVAVISISATASVSLGAKIGRRDAEKALLSIGSEFERALRSYAGIQSDAINAVGARGPLALDELLKDPRSPSVRRHLRQIYADPLNGREQWGLIKDPSGYIIGIYSLADGKPIKQTGFDLKQASFEEAESYAAWVFGLPTAFAQTAKSAGK